MKEAYEYEVVLGEQQPAALKKLLNEHGSKGFRLAHARSVAVATLEGRAELALLILERRKPMEANECDLPKIA